MRRTRSANALAASAGFALGWASGCSVNETRTLDGGDGAPYMSVARVTVTATSVSTSEVSLQVTQGPPYSIGRRATNDSNPSFTPVMTLDSGASLWLDHGQDGTADQISQTGGLNPNWIYTYEVVTLLADATTPDPRFIPLDVTVATYYSAGMPSGLTPISDTVSDPPN